MRILLTAGVTSISLFCFSSIANANPVQTLKLYPGYGTTLNFRSTGETVYKVWLDDPSQVTIDFDDPNCRATTEKSTCKAQIIHLRRIHRLNFPGLPISPTTALTVVTNRSLYQFRLSFPNAGIPLTGIVDVQSSASRSQISRGLQIAASRRLLQHGDALWKRMQAFFRLLDRGTPLNQAAQQVGISLQFIQQLNELGQIAVP